MLSFIRKSIEKSRRYFNVASYENSRPTDYAHISDYLKAHRIIKQNESYSDFLLNAKITSVGETADCMFQRVASTLAKGGRSFYSESQSNYYERVFLDLLSNQKVILSTPLYTNAGRHLDKPLSACAVPTTNLGKMPLAQLAEVVSSYHIKGMGTGFNFDETDDPISTLIMLNELAHTEVTDKKIERPVGNMGIISVDHPKVLDFISSKNNPDIPSWKFNISINLTSGFFKALQNNELYITQDNRKINPESFLIEISKQAGKTGDPGVVFMHKHEEHNKVPHLGHYVSTAPCGEIPLLSGEVCHFGYLNLNAFVLNGRIDYASLKTATHHLVMMLDNAIEVSIQSTLMPESIRLTKKIRKIGIGICGFADVLISMHLQYDSTEARQLGEEIMSFINFESKKASVELAKHRKPFLAYHDIHTRRELIVGKYLHQPTQTVNEADWHELQAAIDSHGIRNLSTVILPPVGRSSLLGGVTASIEPIFRLALDPNFLRALKSCCQRYNYTGDFNRVCQIIENTGSLADTDLPAEVKKVFLTALELDPEAHLAMTSVFQRFIDEAISKTVNLPATATPESICEIYKKAYSLGLKGITIYRDKSRSLQPKSLSENTGTHESAAVLGLLNQLGSLAITKKVTPEKVQNQDSTIHAPRAKF